MKKSWDQSRGPITRLVGWTFNPEPVDAVEDILASLTNFHLYYVMNVMGGNAAKLAWLEYGRRRGFVTFHLCSVMLDGVLEVTATAASMPVTDQISLALEPKPS